MTRTFPFTFVIAGIGFLSACSDTPVSGPAPEFSVPVRVTNKLIAPVSIAIDGKPYVSLQLDETTLLTVSSRNQWLTWSSAKPTDENGIPIPDDIGNVDVAIGGINGGLEISNVIHDRPYITARIYNNTSAPVSIGVFDGTTTTCVSKLPASSATTRRFTQTGYYKLLPSTELRAYRDPTNCTGSFVTWPAAQLQAFAPKSGALLLALDSVP